MDKLAEIKHQFEECQTLLARNQTSILNNGEPDSIRTLYIALSRLVEQTFAEYHIEFFFTRDYFKLFCDVYQTLKKFDPDVSIKLFELVQLIVTNTKNASDLRNVCSLEGFSMFFRMNFDFASNDETVDYFVNIAKSLILKLDSSSSCESVKPVIELALSLSRHRDNLVRTTVRNIILALVRLDNPSIREYVKQFPFRFFFIDLIREIKEKVFSLDRCILEEKVKEIQDAIYFIQESFQFLDEVIHCALDNSTKQFVANLIFVGIFMQVLLPAFRNEIKIIGGHFLGINTVLFVLDSVFAWVQSPIIIRHVVFDMLLNDNLVLDKNEIFDMNLFFEATPKEIGSKHFFQNLGDIFLFAPSSYVREDMPDSIPVLLSSQVKGKVFQTLLAFFKSKDDNMILITTNIFMHIFTYSKITFDVSMIGTLEKIIELLKMDPSLRLITCENLCRVFHYVVKNSTQKSPELPKLVFPLLEMKTRNIKKILETDKFCELLTARFRKVAHECDRENFFESYRPSVLTWLALYNYNYSAMQSKDLRYIGLDYKVELNDEEYIEAEVRLFILFKNLRYSIFDDSILLDFEKNIPKVYSELYASIDNPNFVEGATLLLNFEHDKHLVRLFSGESTETGHAGAKLYLASFGRDLILIEEVDKSQRLYRIIFREYYANVIYYIHRSNPRQMNLTLKSKVKFWGVIFTTAQVCLQAKNLLDDIFKDFMGKEKHFIATFLKKYETDIVA